MIRSLWLNKSELIWGNPQCMQCQDAYLLPRPIAMCFGVLVCRHTVWYHSLQVSHWMAPCLLVHVLIDLIQICHLDDTGPGLRSMSPERSKIKMKCFSLYLHILYFHCLKVISFIVLKIEV